MAQHFSFGTNACDLSLFDYGMAYTLKGQLMADPFHQFGFGKWISKDGELTFERIQAGRWESHFAIHFTPIIFFYVPFYLILDGPLFLLHLQVLFVGLSALFLYLIAKHIFKEGLVPIVIATVYLLFRHLLIGLMHDIHMEMLFPFFILGAFYFIAVKKKPWLYLVFISIALMIKEDIAVYLFFFGLFIFFKLKERKLGLLTSVLSLAYFIVAMEIAIPHFRALAGMNGTYIYDHIVGRPEESLFQTALYYLLHPASVSGGVPMGVFLEKLSNILSPLLLIPLLSTSGLLMIPPVAAALITKNPQIYTFGIHYSAVLLPFVFLAFIYGFRNIQNACLKRGRGKEPDTGGRGAEDDGIHVRTDGRPLRIWNAAPIAALGLIVLINVANSNIWRIIKPSRYSHVKDYKDVRRLINLIPRDASVAAQSALVPHIPKRRDIYMLPENGDGTTGAEYVLVHTGVNPWPYQRAELLKFVKRLRTDESYAVIQEINEIILFKRNSGTYPKGTGLNSHAYFSGGDFPSGCPLSGSGKFAAGAHPHPYVPHGDTLPPLYP